MATSESKEFTRNVLICSDLSSHSSEKFLNWCITKLRLSKADKVTLFHVFEWQDLTDLPLDDEVMAIGTGNLESIQSEEKKKVKEGIVKGMENLLKVAQEKGINAEVKIVEGVPKVKICEFAEKLKTDVVVMASRGMGAMKRFFLGSNSDYCIHNCPSSVVIVREQDLKSIS
uniref:UspA domain-containing protein n=2 Tax=Lotharella globosa TaxID=91324 RepID=A0A6V3JUJ5_9EUKA|mmetsp:Transcript_1400/g.2665  ORF Transcript_1400/g.2665 Transcript_1400/m.2665 type:complete len:172 (-) Transcript_1400:224-739(-)|eukprot:CAMPEP_0167794912 /NCGR_PEP_ID=MMETSP0111_2-20121227/14120_1 /TAXON_ID=91324 /ORGANISM="Lotharella globosa, Strain CCCM811" /LENGTH=171 /DNA_ID=CAMNT_0007688475 /DNA_START=15 /DNA_END=530 /DNA_ORIENTATION=+